jgi:hypothetical protein
MLNRYSMKELLKLDAVFIFLRAITEGSATKSDSFEDVPHGNLAISHSFRS